MPKTATLVAAEKSSAPLLEPRFPALGSAPLKWGKLYGAAEALLLANAAQTQSHLIVVVTADSRSAQRLESELRFFAGDSVPVLSFPDWETLPYDVFSPLPEIISQRLHALHHLPDTHRGILIVPVTTMMQQVAPRDFLESRCLAFKVDQQFDLDKQRRILENSGYRCVPQVEEHGEFAVRGSLVDLFPMGASQPYRIDLFDETIETIRVFDPETQRSAEKVQEINLFPGQEFPTDEDAITLFRRNFRQAFDIDVNDSTIYRDISNGRIPGGIEYYLPLFFEKTDSLFSFLPDDVILIEQEGVRDIATDFFSQVSDRYDVRRTDADRPALPPEQLYLEANALHKELDTHCRARLQHFEHESSNNHTHVNYPTSAPAPLLIQARAENPLSALQQFIETFHGRILFCTESAGRRESLLDLLHNHRIRPKTVDTWQEFLSSEEPICITVGNLESGLLLTDTKVTIIAENQLFGARVQQKRRRRAHRRDADSIVRNLTELHIGAPVVHEDHGVGRYLGMETLKVGRDDAEFIALAYADNAKLYVPVASLHLISRYSGASPENAPLHRLGGDQWQRIRKRATEKLRDVAAELLDLYARREARVGHAFVQEDDATSAFAASFPFEETEGQQAAIDDVLNDMALAKPMDRVVCGDVGFGKTEVAMRAAFAAVQGGKQVAVLVPTTLLAQQHEQNFRDRFADWPFRIEGLSRFRKKKEQEAILGGMADGTVDIVIGTHKLIQKDVRFKRIGIIIVDEEHRFGVRHKEQLKQLRAEVDLLTLTATPIPRTLNMSLAGIRDLSIIATPPAHRHPIKTFVSEWNDATIVEACLRETKRGGQIYIMHNEVKTIAALTDSIEELLPGVRIQFAHGQMPERELEQIMLDFYHRRFDILVCTTIIESGIDIPTANTIIINRADKLGLAQLHQLRGRVGRSHHRAYAYLITPPVKTMTPDAVKRLEAIESMEDLGAGFALASHDLEIRGAGELLGDEQSGQIHEIGFTLYMDLLERTIAAIKSGEHPNLDAPLHQGAEINLQAPALIPDDFLPDIHERLVLYKRIAAAKTAQDLRELQVEMIDRFGLLPDGTKNLFKVMELKQMASPIGIKKIDIDDEGGRVDFVAEPKINPMAMIKLIQNQSDIYKLAGKDKLRFNINLETVEERVDFLNELIRTLSPET